MKSDIEIAQGIELKPIAEIAASLGLSGDDIIPYGRYVAKIPISVMDHYQEAPDGKVILVTAMSPTSMGEGKTTTTIGLGQALNHIGKKAIMAIREPSLGPCMGLKGGPRAADIPRCCPWKTSTSTSPATSTPSPRPTTCWPLWWTITSTTGTPRR